MKRGALHLGIILVLVSGTIAAATLSSDQVDDRVHTALAAGKSPLPLKAEGEVTGLYPGALKTMRVRIRNRYPNPVYLRWVTTTVGDANPACTAENLALERQRRVRMVIRPQRSRQVRIEVSMLSSAPDACQGARFPLRFHVRGNQ